LLALGFSALLVFGVVLVLLGANQAEMARDLGLDLADSGLMVAVLSGGLGVGVVAAGPLIDSFARRPIFLTAMGICAIALFGFSAEIDFARVLIQVGVLGLGLGLYDTLISALVSERYPENSARPMAAVHSAACIGAMLGPLFVAWAVADIHWSASFRWLGAAHLVLGAAALFVPLAPPARAVAGVDGIPGDLRFPPLLPLALVAFAYVGIEASITIFAVPYTESGLGLSEAQGQRAISGFWLGLFIGRLSLLFVRRTIDARLLVAAGLAGAVTLGGSVALGIRAPGLTLGATGLTLGFVFPLMASLVGERFPRSRGTAIGMAMGAAAFGGFVIPWLHGAIGDRFGIDVALGSLSGWSILIAISALIAYRIR
jgi:fucose permease